MGVNGRFLLMGNARFISSTEGTQPGVVGL